MSGIRTDLIAPTSCKSNLENNRLIFGQKKYALNSIQDHIQTPNKIFQHCKRKKKGIYLTVFFLLKITTPRKKRTYRRHNAASQPNQILAIYPTTLIWWSPLLLVTDLFKTKTFLWQKKPCPNVRNYTMGIQWAK